MSEEPTAKRSEMDYASEQEAHLNWLGAAESYDKALKQLPDKDHQRIGDILERKAYTLHKAAFQEEGFERFKERTKEAIEFYKKAESAYENVSGPVGNGKRLRCESMVAYLSYWLATSHAEEKKLADVAWAKARSSLNVFEASGDSVEFATTFNQVSYAAAFSYNYDSSSEGRENTLKEALSYAEKSTRHLSTLNMPVELAKAHAKCTGLMVAVEKDFAPYSEKDRYDLNAWNNWVKARELSEETALLEIPFMVVLQSWPAACSTEERCSIYEKGKEVAEKSKDKFVIGCVLDGLAQRKFCLAMSAEDTREIDRLANEGFEIAKASKESLDIVRFVSPNVICVWIPVPAAGYYYSYACEESDPKTQRELFFKAHPLCIEQLKQAHESGYPDVECAAHFMLGSVLKGLGKSESGIEMKKSYLEKAVEHLKEAIAVDKQIHPKQYYPQGLDLLSLAEAQFEIAQVTTDLEKKMSILREAILRKQEALGLCEKELNATQDTNPDISGEIATGFHTTGNWARELCVLAGDTSCLGVVAECLEKAVVWYMRAGLYSQSAECNWEAAEAYDDLSEFRKSSERFELAADDYGKAAESVPRLKEFYADHAIYMRAWGEIEQARYHHLRQEPGQAKEHYENASAMHKSSRRWSYLATNYSAWAEVEHAEDLSRSESYDESIGAFEKASHLFQESKSSLHDQVAKIEDNDEKQLVRNLERAANSRRDYCKARIVLEKARSFDKQGDVSASSDKYGQAAELLEKMMPELESEQDRKELQLVATLSRAWQAMAKAESETSPNYYETASELFEKARDLSMGEKAKLLVAGHSRFCKALGMGARFVETGDVALHAGATKHMESAADYYLKAGHQRESDYAKASKLLFDGYVHMGKASAEEDQEKKARLYMVAEKVFNTSAEAYEKAKQPSKKSQVLRLSEKVKEERELALSLTGVIRAPDILSSTTAFSAPTPSHETTTGLDKFGHADVQVTLIVHPKHLIVGQNLEVDAEMTNAGRGAAKLTKIEGLLLDEFEVVDKPDMCRIEHNHINLKGRHLEALRTESIRLVLKPTVRGRFTLKPRVFYTDESGAQRDHVADQVEITVSEMGLSGWLRGSDKKR
ncbi:MAG TPA: hypothetical protein VGB78_08255 [Thermoplasmata archaeon]